VRTHLRRIILPTFITVVLVALIAHAFVRSFIEQGEERFWLFWYLVLISAVASILAYYLSLPYKFWIRGVIAGAVFFSVGILAYQIPKIADLIGVGKIGRAIYGYMVDVEGLYLRFFSYEEQHRQFHKRKVLNANLLRAFKSCSKDSISSILDEYVTNKDYSINEFGSRILNGFIASDRCSEELRQLVKNKWFLNSGK
jgi:hypothetical protein